MNKILIVDFGSQYTQLIARQIRNLCVYCQVEPYQNFDKVKNDKNIKTIILSGGPHSVTNAKYPNCNLENIDIPIIGICYGSQLIAKKIGGQVVSNKLNAEYGNTEISIYEKHKLLNKVDQKFNVIMSHNDSIKKIPGNIIAMTEKKNIAIFQYKNYYGFQFHPEVSHSSFGEQIFKNIIMMSGCCRNWTTTNFIKQKVEEIKIKLGKDKVIMALSGGVDSTVAAHLIYKAIGDNLKCVIINNGLMRKNEYDNIIKYCQKFNMEILPVDACESFYNCLEKVVDPELKRKKIGHKFIEIFTHIAKNENTKWLGQGTIYPDIIESVKGVGKIKSHHNVGGLPEDMELELIEPLRLLFKDEVRKVGEELCLSKEIIYRHPFPGPGLAIRILGEVTKEKVKTLQEADNIYIQKIKEYGLYSDIWQAGAILLPIKTVGVMGDIRTYGNVIALRAVTSINGMTADWYPFTHEFLLDVSTTIINQVKGCNRVVYDISSKPPATIEWE